MSDKISSLAYSPFFFDFLASKSCCSSEILPSTDTNDFAKVFHLLENFPDHNTYTSEQLAKTAA